MKTFLFYQFVSVLFHFKISMQKINSIALIISYSIGANILFVTKIAVFECFFPLEPLKNMVDILIA